MRWFLTAVGVLFGITVFMFLDYALPSKQTVRITEAFNRQIEIGRNAIFYAADDTGTVQNSTGRRDVQFINAVRTNGKPYVYRNEDTGWIWPPYFKYDSADLQAQAADLRSTSATPEWVSITSYGWRVNWLSVYPNAISIKPVSGPDVRPFNWGAIVILLILGALLMLIWRMWNQFRERSLDPAWDRIDAEGDAARGRLSRWWRGMRGR